MSDILSTPSLWVLGALVAYLLTYYFYTKWVDEKVWDVSADRTTPAHMYMDGVEFFPVSRSVLWGFQFKSIAALGPILGPFVAISYGWLPALLWIILGNVFIGWAHDYSSIMISVRNEGRSMGPLVYQYVGGDRPRTILLGYLLFYLLIISAVFIYLIALFWNVFPGTFLATVVVFIAAIIVGQLLYRFQMNVIGVTIFAIIMVLVAVWVGAAIPWPPVNYFGEEYTMLVWSLILAVFLFFAALSSMPTFITPMNFISAFPAIGGVIILIIGALLTPATGISLGQPSIGKFEVLMGSIGPGPIFPVLFVTIACGAVSGWHSLVGSSTTAKQLDVELDARPVGAGAMLTEGLLALSALAAYMIIPAGSDVFQKGKVAAFVTGAKELASAYLGGEAMLPFWASFFALFLVIYAFTVQTLVTRYWRLVSGELFTGGFSFLGNKYIATIIGLLIPILFALSGSWINLWIYFGGSNQLLAGLALFLAAIIVARMRRPTAYVIIPAIFMLIVTLSALGWETYLYGKKVLAYLESGDVNVLFANPPLKSYPAAALFMNVVFIFIGLILIGLGFFMAYYLFKSYSTAQKSE